MISKDMPVRPATHQKAQVMTVEDEWLLGSEIKDQLTNLGDDVVLRFLPENSGLFPALLVRQQACVYRRFPTRDHLRDRSD
jgi:hypothetical protein